MGSVLGREGWVTPPRGVTLPTHTHACRGPESTPRFPRSAGFPPSRKGAEQEAATSGSRFGSPGFPAPGAGMRAPFGLLPPHRSLLLEGVLPALSGARPPMFRRVGCRQSI